MHEYLKYEPESGFLYWAKSIGARAKVGNLAGSKNGEGYVQIKVQGRVYLAHRIAWLLTYGNWPIDEIDHINGDRSDNRIKNLRAVSRSMNQRNAQRRMDNTSGIIGVRKVTYKNTPYWAAYWFDNKMHTKWFNINKLGESAALLSAIKHRKEQMQLLGGFTDRHA